MIKQYDDLNRHYANEQQPSHEQERLAAQFQHEKGEHLQPRRTLRRI